MFFRTTQKFSKLAITLLVLFSAIFQTGFYQIDPELINHNFNPPLKTIEGTIKVEPNGAPTATTNINLSDMYWDELNYSIERNDGQPVKGGTVYARARFNSNNPSCSAYLIVASSANKYTDTETKKAEISLASNWQWSSWVEINIAENYALVQLGGRNDCQEGNTGKFDLEVKYKNTSQPPSQPTIQFWAERETITEGECTNLRWVVTNAGYVVVDHERRNSLSGSKPECPVVDTKYDLDVYDTTGNLYMTVHANIYVTPKSPSPEPVPAQPVAITFWADSYSITKGTCTKIRWNVTNASDIYINDYVVGLPYAWREECPVTTTTYVLVAVDKNNNRFTKSIVIYVNQTQLSPQVTFWAEPGAITPPALCTILHWSGKDLQYAQIDGVGVSNTGGQTSKCPTVTTTYVLEGKGLDGSSVREEVKVIVEKPVLPPSATFWPDQFSVLKGKCTFLNWKGERLQTASIDNKVVNNTNQGRIEKCPEVKTTYIFRGTGTDGSTLPPQQVTIDVQVPKEIESECIKKDGYILIVTNSKKLNLSVSDPSAWEKVREGLKSYYISAANGCVGAPVFLDLSEMSGSSDGYELIDRQIEAYLASRSPIRPTAIAIIGGPNVIPYGKIFINNGSTDPILTDDPYADFNHDPYLVPDTVITRLPDGHSLGLLTNYIARLANGRQPPEGSALMMPFQDAYERLAIPTGTSSARLITGSYTSKGHCYLENYLQVSTGSCDVYLFPPWLRDKATIPEFLPGYIRTDDLINQKAFNGGSAQLTKRDLVLVGFSNPTNYTWFTWDITDKNKIIPVLDEKIVKALPEGVQIFAAVSHSADLTEGIKTPQEITSPQGSIPLAALANNARFFIGTTGQVGLSPSSSNYVSLGNKDYLAISTLDVDKFDLAFVKAFYGEKCAPIGPAFNFFDAKRKFTADLNSPLYQRSLHSYIFYGLPEKFGSLEGTCTLMEPLDSFGSIACDELNPPIPPTATNCPSGNPNDCDGDGLSNKEELEMAEFFKPYLIFDEGEKLWSQKNNPFAVYWQASPGSLAGSEGVFITYVMTYPQDWGMHDFDISVKEMANCQLSSLSSFKSCFNTCTDWSWDSLYKCPACLAVSPYSAAFSFSTNSLVIGGGLLTDVIGNLGVNLNASQWAFGHAGDTEAFRIFIAEQPNNLYEIKYINWKRHLDKFDKKGMLQTIDEAMKDGLQFSTDGHHPILWVSENKHAMYPTKSMCSSYEMDLGMIGLQACKVTFEDCGGHRLYNEKTPYIPLIVQKNNVGEIDEPTIVDMSPNYPGENAWAGKDEAFCGGHSEVKVGVALLDSVCASGLGSLWVDPKNSFYQK